MADSHYCTVGSKLSTEPSLPPGCSLNRKEDTKYKLSMFPTVQSENFSRCSWASKASYIRLVRIALSQLSPCCVVSWPSSAWLPPLIAQAGCGSAPSSLHNTTAQCNQSIYRSMKCSATRDIQPYRGGVHPWVTGKLPLLRSRINALLHFMNRNSYWVINNDLYKFNEK